MTYRLPLNDGRHHLHGGPGGMGRALWSMEPDTAADAVQLSYFSPNGDEGYPGALEVTLVYRLQDYRLTFELTARPEGDPSLIPDAHGIA